MGWGRRGGAPSEGAASGGATGEGGQRSAKAPAGAGGGGGGGAGSGAARRVERVGARSWMSSSATFQILRWGRQLPALPCSPPLPSLLIRAGNPAEGSLVLVLLRPSDLGQATCDMGVGGCVCRGAQEREDGKWTRWRHEPFALGRSAGLLSLWAPPVFSWCPPFRPCPSALAPLPPLRRLGGEAVPERWGPGSPPPPLPGGSTPDAAGPCGERPGGVAPGSLRVAELC